MRNGVSDSNFRRDGDVWGCGRNSGWEGWNGRGVNDREGWVWLREWRTEPFESARGEVFGIAERLCTQATVHECD